MTKHLGLIVTDSSPLITLAAADNLHLLTAPKLPVMIPDMVYHETTRHIAKLGAAAIVDWVRKSRPLVTIEPTEAFAEYMILLANDPKTRARDRGERAASEVLSAAVAADSDLAALLLFEDSDVVQRRFMVALPDRVFPITTGAYLRILENEGRIQSADFVLDQAMARGRDVSKQRSALPEVEVANALRSVVRSTHGSTGP